MKQEEIDRRAALGPWLVPNSVPVWVDGVPLFTSEIATLQADNAELQAELASLRATVQNAEIVMVALRERDALVRQAARAFVAVSHPHEWQHAPDCPYATARAALVALLEEK